MAYQYLFPITKYSTTNDERDNNDQSQSARQFSPSIALNTDVDDSCSHMSKCKPFTTLSDHHSISTQWKNSQQLEQKFQNQVSNLTKNTQKEQEPTLVSQTKMVPFLSAPKANKSIEIPCIAPSCKSSQSSLCTSDCSSFLYIASPLRDDSQRSFKPRRLVPHPPNFQFSDYSESSEGHHSYVNIPSSASTLQQGTQFSFGRQVSAHSLQEYKPKSHTDNNGANYYDSSVEPYHYGVSTNFSAIKRTHTDRWLVHPSIPQHRFSSTIFDAMISKPTTYNEAKCLLQAGQHFSSRKLESLPESESELYEVCEPANEGFPNSVLEPEPELTSSSERKHENIPMIPLRTSLQSIHSIPAVIDVPYPSGLDCESESSQESTFIKHDNSKNIVSANKHHSIASNNDFDKHKSIDTDENLRHVTICTKQRLEDLNSHYFSDYDSPGSNEKTSKNNLSVSIGQFFPIGIFKFIICLLIILLLATIIAILLLKCLAVHENWLSYFLIQFPLKICVSNTTTVTSNVTNHNFIDSTH